MISSINRGALALTFVAAVGFAFTPLRIEQQLGARILSSGGGTDGAGSIVGALRSLSEANRGIVGDSAQRGEREHFAFSAAG